MRRRYSHSPMPIFGAVWQTGSFWSFARAKLQRGCCVKVWSHCTMPTSLGLFSMTAPAKTLLTITRTMQVLVGRDLPKITEPAIDSLSQCVLSRTHRRAGAVGSLDNAPCVPSGDDHPCRAGELARPLV